MISRSGIPFISNGHIEYIFEKCPRKGPPVPIYMERYHLLHIENIKGKLILYSFSEQYPGYAMTGDPSDNPLDRSGLQPDMP